MKEILQKLPSWFFSVALLVFILWLTLAPKPLGEDPPKLFPGADKIAHGLMFAFFTAVMIFDWLRKHKWSILKTRIIILFSLISSLSGILIEYAQKTMGMGRSLEYADMVADTLGAFIFAIVFFIFQKIYIQKTIV